MPDNQTNPSVLPDRLFKHTMHADVQKPIEIDPKSLRSLKTYTCVNHPNKEAHCICVKCGNMLCQDCGFAIEGRRYCKNCVEDDDQLIMALQREILRPKIVQTAVEIQSCRPMRHISDIPVTFRNMFREGPIFFVTAKDSSFHLTYYMAAIAMIPNAIIQLVVRYDDIVKNAEEIIKQNGPLTPDLQLSLKMLSEMPVSTRALMAVLITLIQILLLDLLYWACIRAFTSSSLKFTQAGAQLHFCLLPLIFMSIGTYFDMPLISFVALALMIIQATTATRVSTKCGFLQGMGVMLAFIILSTLTHLL